MLVPSHKPVHWNIPVRSITRSWGNVPYTSKSPGCLYIKAWSFQSSCRKECFHRWSEVFLPLCGETYFPPWNRSDSAIISHTQIYLMEDSPHKCHSNSFPAVFSSSCATIEDRRGSDLYFGGRYLHRAVIRLVSIQAENAQYDFIHMCPPPINICGSTNLVMAFCQDWARPAVSITWVKGEKQYVVSRSNKNNFGSHPSQIHWRIKSKHIPILLLVSCSTSRNNLSCRHFKP